MESRSLKEIINETTALIKALTIIPAKIIVSIAKLLLLNLTNPKTTSKDINPLKIATTGSVKLPNPTIVT